jgi:integrase
MTDVMTLMASLHKDPRGKSPFWYVAYVAPNGRRAFKSTKERDRKKAAEIARALEKASEQARGSELTEARVRKLLDDVLESVGEGPVRSVSVRSFATTWLTNKQPSVRPNVLRLYRRALERFCDCLGAKADKNLASLTPSDIAAFQVARTSEVASGTALLDLKTVRSVLDNARRQGLIPSNPAEAIDLPVNRPNTREVFTPDELRALLSAASGEWRTLILCGYFLGGRLGDMAALRWEDLDLTTNVVRFTQGKTGGRIEIPLHAELADHLLAIAGDQGGHLCPTLAQTRLNGRCGLSSRFAGLMESAGCSRGQVQSTKNSFARKSFDSLRHSFTSALTNAGVAPELRMKLTGHLSMSAHTKYTHFELLPLRQAIESLPRLEQG